MAPNKKKTLCPNIKHTAENNRFNTQSIAITKQSLSSFYEGHMRKKKEEDGFVFLLGLALGPFRLNEKKNHQRLLGHDQAEDRLLSSNDIVPQYDLSLQTLWGAYRDIALHNL